MTGRKLVLFWTALICGLLLATSRLQADDPAGSSTGQSFWGFYSHGGFGNSSSHGSNNSSDNTGSTAGGNSGATDSGSVSSPAASPGAANTAAANTSSGGNTSSGTSNTASSANTTGNNRFSGRFGNHAKHSSNSTTTPPVTPPSLPPVTPTPPITPPVPPTPPITPTPPAPTPPAPPPSTPTPPATPPSTQTTDPTAGSGAIATQVPAPALRKPNTFVIGVFSQPIANFPTFIAQGINTFVQWETSNSPLEWWAGEATLQGASTIRVPSTQPDWETWDSGFSPAGGIAWALPDEPDGNGVTPDSLAATAAQYRAVQHGNNALPIWLNVRGGSLNGMQAPPSPIGQYLACADWIAEDFYPITGWGQTNLLLANGQILDQIAAAAPGKPKMCFIECSNQQLSWLPNDTCVTPEQMRCEIWDAVIHGAYGIIYFPQQIGNGFSFDARPANIITEMTAENAVLRDLTFESGTQIPASAPFECCLRNYKGQPTYIVLNPSTNAAALPNGQVVAAQNVVMVSTNPFPPPAASSTASPQAVAQIRRAVVVRVPKKPPVVSKKKH